MYYIRKTLKSKSREKNKQKWFFYCYNTASDASKRSYMYITFLCRLKKIFPVIETHFSDICHGCGNTTCNYKHSLIYFVFTVYKGCYVLDNSLQQILALYTDQMTIGMCVERCRAADFSYANLRKGFCGCSSSITTSVAGGKCYETCPGASGQLCGGDRWNDVMSVYDVGKIDGIT